MAVCRICPECGARWYSANSSDADWICGDCGTRISIAYQIDTMDDNCGDKEA